MRFAVLVLALVLVPSATAHGDLAVNELETLAIRDFEGMEDSFPWGGFEIWDVYVGDGYNVTYDADGVYFKVNFAGDGTTRPPGQSAWQILFTFSVGDEAFERIITHDGTTVSTDFESLEWMVADGNVFQVKAWVPIANATGKAVKDIVVLTSVDGDPRDVAPGGVYAPGSGTEAPVEAPASPVFPPIGEGRIVEEVALTGGAKYLNVTVEDGPGGTFAISATNALKEQGQHVMFAPRPASGWNLTGPSDWGANLDGGKSITFDFTLTPETSVDGVVPPLRIDLVTDIGGRQTFYAFMEGEDVTLTGDAAAAMAAKLPSVGQDVPGVGMIALLLGAFLAVMTGPRRR